MKITDRRNGCKKFDDRIISENGDYTTFACGCYMCDDYSDEPGNRYHEIDYYCNECIYRKENNNG